MDPEKPVTIMNNLIQVNNDRIEGYKTAAQETDDREFKSLFAKLASTSQECLAELKKEVQKLGGEPEKGTQVSGKFFRVWMDVKAALTGNDKKAILDSCEFGEDAAVKVYIDTLDKELEFITANQEALIRNQYLKIKADHDTVKSLKDAEV